MSSESLQESLDIQRKVSQERNPELFATVEAAKQELFEMGILERALKPGDSAPDFMLPNAYGSLVSLKDLLKRGSVVLTFYRGDWCPYCNLTLRAYQTILPELLKMNTVLVAISPQSPRHALSLSTRHHLAYQVLSDEGNKVSQDYRLVYEMPELLRRAYESQGHDMVKQHGSWQLPLPATFVISQTGRLRYVHMNIDYMKRAEPAEILAVVRSL